MASEIEETCRYLLIEYWLVTKFAHWAVIRSARSSVPHKRYICDGKSSSYNLQTMVEVGILPGIDLRESQYTYHHL